MNLSKNEILFDCESDILNQNPDSICHVHGFLEAYRNAEGNEEIAQENFSHDNFTGVYCWCVSFMPNWISHLPLLGRFSIHPVRFMFYFFIKYPILGSIFLPIIYIDMMISGLQKTKINSRGLAEIPTSSKILDYFRIRAIIKKGGFGGILMEKLLTKAVNWSVGGWDRVFGIYFSEDHRVMKAYRNQ